MSYWMAVRRRLMAIALAGIDVAALAIAYTGAMTDQIVTMGDGKQYRLLTLTSSGTLTVEKPVQADIWMCGGGGGGNRGYYGSGGGGGYVNSGYALQLSTNVAVIGTGAAGNGGTSGISAFMGISAAGGKGAVNGSETPDGGSGGGQGGYNRYGGNGSRGSGAGVTTYPFGDSVYFSERPHSAGGGGGSYRDKDDHVYGGGGAGGSNGGNGASRVSGQSQGAGGSYGGGDGGFDSNGRAAYFYGGGGGGGAYLWEDYSEHNYSGGAGYQGVIYIRIPLDQPKPASVTDFQMVEYIGTTGTQYINTGISLGTGFRAVIKVKITQSLNRLQCLIGSHETAAPYYRNYLIVNANMASWNLGAYDAFNFGSCALNTVYEIDVSNISGVISCKINGAAQTINGTPGSVARSDRPLYLLALNHVTDLLPACANLYYCKIYNPAGELVGDFVPCYRKSDNVPGLWDKVGKRFYTNIGTGAFTLGANV